MAEPTFSAKSFITSWADSCDNFTRAITGITLATSRESRCLKTSVAASSPISERNAATFSTPDIFFISIYLMRKIGYLIRHPFFQNRGSLPRVIFHHLLNSFLHSFFLITFRYNVLHSRCHASLAFFIRQAARLRQGLKSFYNRFYYKEYNKYY